MIINLGQKQILLGVWPLLRGSEPLCAARLVLDCFNAFCVTKFLNQKYLRDYEDWHNRENCFKCTYCGKNFSQIIVPKSMS